MTHADIDTDALKRYPGSDSEYEIILHRHNEVLAELSIQPALLVVTSCETLSGLWL